MAFLHSQSQKTSTGVFSEHSAIQVAPELLDDSSLPASWALDSGHHADVPKREGQDSKLEGSALLNADMAGDFLSRGYRIAVDAAALQRPVETYQYSREQYLEGSRE